MFQGHLNTVLSHKPIFHYTALDCIVETRKRAKLVPFDSSVLNFDTVEDIKRAVLSMELE
jgi:hypothetical protein